MHALIVASLLSSVAALAVIPAAASPFYASDKLPPSSRTRTGLKEDGSPKIEHIVVLMLENRPFDHMCGRLNKWGVPVDGVKDDKTYYNDYNGQRYYTADTCPYVNPFDPIHSIHGTTSELGLTSTKWTNPAPMSGFVSTHAANGDPGPQNVMTGFSPDRVPAISTLAKEFVTFDKYFAALPGPTMPNRLYFHSGTSHGMAANNITDYILGLPQRSIYNVLEDHNLTWATYFEDLPDILLLRRQRTLKNLEKNFKWYDTHFAKDAAAGTLPYFTWVAPRFYAEFSYPPRDQHPDHDVVHGEEIIAETYAAVRNGPKWNSTLFIVTYDEHGGFYDHVPPHDPVPSPDGINGSPGTKNEFNWTRGGVRICTVMASPWVSKGEVVGAAPAGGYEHSSMYATLRRLNGFDEQLTNRTAWAAPFDFILNSQATPRTDCPTSLPVPQEHTRERTRRILDEILIKQPNGLQKELYSILEGAAVKDTSLHTGGAEFTTQEAMGMRVRELMETLVPRE